MSNRRIDPAQLEGEELARWYQRTPDEIESERSLAEQQEYDAFFGDGPWREARVKPPRAPPPVRPAPSRVAVPSGEGAPPPAGAPGSFFGTYAPLGRGYAPGLPSPLNRVEPSLVMRDQYVLGDGTIVSTDEVERIYAEQQRRIRGADLAPSPYARAVDRMPDGRIPRPDQLEKGTWERDPTCHPYGGWEIDPGFQHYPKRSQDYEEQITGARGVDYVVRAPGAKRGVKFDGCDVDGPSHALLEAKGPGYAGLLARALRSTFGQFVTKGLQGQAERQAGVAEGRPIDWFIAEQPAMKTFAEDIIGGRPIRPRHVPAR